MPLGIFITHAPPFFTLFNNPIDNVSPWCNTDRQLSMILSLHSNTKTGKVKGFDKHFLTSSAIKMARNKFPNCVYSNVKVSNHQIQFQRI
jgi:hypothetical protein